jgi:two-component system osmolarity sensor histidine kinase EnvZ
MSQDIEQINAILGKFLDYARPHVSQLQIINLAAVVAAAAQFVNNAAKDAQDIAVSNNVSTDLQVMADAVELQRVIANLLENARRYGKSTIYPAHMMETKHLPHVLPMPDAKGYEADDEAWSPTRLFEEPVEIAKVDIDARIQGDWVVLTVRDHGAGVSPEVLNQLNVPFFRANEARSNVTGTGLGLAIVEKAVQGMQGKISLSNWGIPLHQDNDNALRRQRKTGEEGGFMAEISLIRPEHKLAAQKAASDKNS